jgi:hypothetical protein
MRRAGCYGLSTCTPALHSLYPVVTFQAWTHHVAVPGLSGGESVTLQVAVQLAPSSVYHVLTRTMPAPSVTHK